MKRSNFVKNLVLGYEIKTYIDNEETIKKEMEKIIEKEEKKAIDVEKM